MQAACLFGIVVAALPLALLHGCTQQPSPVVSPQPSLSSPVPDARALPVCPVPDHLAPDEEPPPRSQLSSLPRQLHLWGQGCIVVQGGRVACWGRDEFHEYHAELVPQLSNVVNLADGTEGLCGLTVEGTIQCTEHAGPGTPRLLHGSTAIAELDGDCARSRDGKVVCVDRDKHLSRLELLDGASRMVAFGEGACALRGDVALCSTTDGEKHADIGEAVQLEVAHGVFCALTKSGVVRCRDPWGYDQPVQLEGLSGSTWFALTRGSACGLDARGGLRCGAMGAHDDFGVRGSAAREVKLPGRPRALALSMRWGCAILDKGGVACFGLGSGSPCAVRGLSSIEEIVSEADPRNDSFCARRRDGQVLCFRPPVFHAKFVQGLP